MADIPPAAPFAVDEDLYCAWNPDVAAAIRQGTLRTAQEHWEAFGANEQRPPYGTRSSQFTSPAIEAGDVIEQPLPGCEDWLGGITFSLGTHGHLCRLVMDATLRDQVLGRVLATCRHEEWIADNEEQVLKFPAISHSGRGSLVVLELRIRSIESSGPVHFWCGTAASEDALSWNAISSHRAGLVLELRYVPPTVPGPDGITLNPATACRATCVHCLSRTFRERPAILKPQWVSALHHHFTHGPGVVWCTDYATDIFRIAKQRPEFIDLITSGKRLVMNTDGQDVNAEALRRIYACNVERIGFSCDAATEETYAKIRRGLGRLETVVKNAQMAVRLRRELGLGGRPWLAFSMVVMRSNAHEAVQLVELAARAGVDAVWFNQLWVCNDEMVEESLEFTPEIWREILPLAEERGRELGIGVHDYPTVRPEHPQQGITWCPEPWQAMVVLGNGEVLACASPASRIGNLNESSIEEIWNGPHFQALRRLVHSERPPLMCVHCPIYRKPGNSDGNFMHHLVHDYDVRQDMADPRYAEQFKRRFSFAAYQASRADGVQAEAQSSCNCA